MVREKLSGQTGSARLTHHEFLHSSHWIAKYSIGVRVYNPSVEIRFCIETDRFLETIAKENNGVRDAFDEIAWPRLTSNSAKFGEVRRSSMSIEMRRALYY
jgi:hypothetical protein